VREKGFRTLNTVIVQHVVKGLLLVGERLEISEYGGFTDGIRLSVAGVPVYTPGENVLLFLSRNRDGEWTTDGFALGKFDFVADPRIGMLLLRQEENRVLVRKAESFLGFLERTVRGETAPADYFVPPSLPRNATASTYNPSDFLLANRARWPSFDVPAVFLTNGNQAGVVSSVDAVDLAAALWNEDPNSTIQYVRGGVTNAKRAFRAPDGENTILFNDPSEELCKHTDLTGEQCDFILGMAAIWTRGEHRFNGESLNNIVEADVVITYGAVLDSNAFAHLIAHEFGHTLGLRHSTESDPKSNDALMFPTTSTDSSATLRAWDQMAISTVYGSGPPGASCDGPRFLINPASVFVAAGGQTRLEASVEGTLPIQVQWFHGESGVTSEPVSDATATILDVNDVRISAAYWMRARNPCGIANSTSAQVQITPSRRRPVRGH
jgi:matrixin